MTTSLDNKAHQIVSNIGIFPLILRILVLVPLEFIFTLLRKANGHYKRSTVRIERMIKAKNASVSSEKPVAIVTGANCGIGLSVSKALYRANYHVILACRNEEKATKALQLIKSTNGKGFVEFIKLDLSSFESIRLFSKTFLEKNMPLKVLINNAGISKQKYSMTENQFEETFQANYLGHFLLTKLLTQKLIESKPSRVINTSSNASYFPTKFELNSLLEKTRFSPINTYAQTKLAQLLYTYKYDELYKSKGVECYACHPGAVYTEITRDVKQRYILPILKVLMKSSDVGALTSIKLALMEFPGTSESLYYADEQPSYQPHKDSLNKKVRDELWNVSLRLVSD